MPIKIKTGFLSLANTRILLEDSENTIAVLDNCDGEKINGRCLVLFSRDFDSGLSNAIFLYLAEKLGTEKIHTRRKKYEGYTTFVVSPNNREYVARLVFSALSPDWQDTAEFDARFDIVTDEIVVGVDSA